MSKVKPNLFMAPDLPTSFVQRTTEFIQLKHNLLNADQKSHVAITTVLKGAGGFGKTTLAAALCHDNKVQATFNNGILWVTLSEQGRVLEGLTKLYRALMDENLDFVDIEEGATKLADKLEDKACLLVIDDVWNSTQLRPFLRGGERCARLITTRIQDVALKANAQSIDVDEMTPDEAVSLLTAGFDVDDLEPFFLLANRLGKWPLLLELANGAIRKRMRKRPLSEVIKWVNSALNRKGFTAFEPKSATSIDRNDAIAKSIEISLDLLDKDELKHFTELGIFPEDVAVPLSVIATLWEMDEFDTDELSLLFDDLSLLKYDGQNVRIHDVLRSYLQSQLKESSKIHARLVDNWGDKTNLPNDYAWCFLSYHLYYAEREEQVCEMLLDLGWLQAKLDVTDINWLLNDFQYAGQDQDLQLVASALQMSSNILAKDKKQLPSYLYGRLLSNHKESSRLADLLNKIHDEPPYPILLHLTPVLDQAGGALIRILGGHDNWVNAIAMTPDRRVAISGGGGAGGGEDNTLKLWDLKTGKLTKTLSGHEHWVEAVAITRDGRYAVSAEAEPNVSNKIIVWDLKEGKLLHTWTGHDGDGICGIAITADGQIIVSVGYDRGIKVWKLSTIKTSFVEETLQYKGRIGVNSSDVVAITPDGNTIVSGTPFYRFQVFRKEDQQEIDWPIKAIPTWELNGHKDWISAVAITPDGKTAITGGHRGDGSLKVWDLVKGELLRTMHDDQTDLINSIAISKDGSVAIAAKNNYLTVWDIKSGQLKKKLVGHGNTVTSVALSSDGRIASSGSADRTVRLWDLTAKQTVNLVEKHDQAIGTVAVTSNGQIAVTASLDGNLKIWEITTGRVMKTIRAHRLDAHAVAVTPDGKYAISGGEQDSLKIWEILSGNILAEWKHPSIGKSGIAADDSIVITASGKEIKVWKLDTGELVHVFTNHRKTITAVTLTSDSKYVVSSAHDGRILVWDVIKGKMFKVLTAENKRISTVAITPNRRYILSGGYDNEITIWDFHTGEPQGRLSGHEAPVVTVSVTPSGKYAVSGSHDQKLKVWDITNRHCITTFTADGALYTSAIVNENTVITAGESGRLHVLEIVGTLIEV